MYFHRFQVGSSSDVGMPFLMFHFIKRKISKALFYQGYGRHSSDESTAILTIFYFLNFRLQNKNSCNLYKVYNIGKQDLEALENFLGDKKFLFGDALCNEDAVLFAYIAQINYYDKGPLKAYLRSLFFVLT
jgi:hypothetical protein